MNSCISFWTGFNNIDNFFTHTFSKFNFCELSSKTTTAIIGSFVNQHDVQNISLYPNITKKILVITEPISNLFPLAYDLYINSYFDCVICAIHQDKKINHYRYPFYYLYMDWTKVLLFDYVNLRVKNQSIENIKKLNFCCLINTHDNGNTRTPIYNSLKNIGHITCPSQLFNNTSNEELNKNGKVKYLSNFLFNICPENFNTAIDGYVTEKIFESCQAGCIPIYYGRFEDTEIEIFNISRIIFVDPHNEVSVSNMHNIVNELMNNDEKLLNFYSQPIFNNNAYINMHKIHTDFIDDMYVYLKNVPNN
jgi:hypothetical protein